MACSWVHRHLTKTYHLGILVLYLIWMTCLNMHPHLIEITYHHGGLVIMDCSVVMIVMMIATAVGILYTLVMMVVVMVMTVMMVIIMIVIVIVCH